MLAIGTRGSELAVASEGLHPQQSGEILSQGLVDFREQRYCLVVVVTLRVLAQASAAERIGRRDSGVHAVRDVRIGEVVLVLEDLGCSGKLLRLVQAPLASRLSTGTRTARHQSCGPRSWR